MGGLGRKGWRIGPWQRRLLIGLAVAPDLPAVSDSVGGGLPGLHRRHPLPGPAGDHDAGEPPPGHWAGHRTVRGDDAAGTGPGGRMPPGEALRMEYPGGVFYLCYDCVLCLLIRDRRTASLGADGSGLSGQ